MKIETIGVVGVGAIGIYYGCQLVAAGREVRFLLRGDYEAVKKQGFQVESAAGKLTIAEPQVYRSAAEMGTVDLVIVAWKATANQHAEEVIAPLLHENTKILTLQNGLGNVELLEELFGKGRVLGGLCFVGVNRLSAGKIAHITGGAVTVGEPEPTGVLAELPELFGERVRILPVESLGLAQWRKLVWNIPFNGLCVVEGGIDTAALLQREGMAEEVTKLMREVIAGAGALGYEIPNDFCEEQLAKTYPMGPYKPSSMLDYVAGLPLEVEAIWGEPLRQAQQAGVEMPALASLYQRLLIADGEREERQKLVAKSLPTKALA